MSELGKSHGVDPCTSGNITAKCRESFLQLPVVVVPESCSADLTRARARDVRMFVRTRRYVTDGVTVSRADVFSHALAHTDESPTRRVVASKEASNWRTHYDLSFLLLFLMVMLACGS